MDALLTFAIVFGIGLVALYVWFLPIDIAKKKGLRNYGGIKLLTILGVLIWPLWLVALIAAALATPEEV